MDDAPADDVEALHGEIDREAGAIIGRLGARITCHRGCAGCCVDGLTVFSVEADCIRNAAGDALAGAVPAAPGACAFLDTDGGCRIYDARPYVCRTQGLPLRWLDDESGDVVEYRDICPLNADGQPIETLDAADCWTIGPVEERLVHIQLGAGARQAERIGLRELFDELAARRG